MSHLSAARTALVRLCQSINFGEICRLQVHDGEPFLSDPDTTVCRDIKLHPAELAREELSLEDFVLAAEWSALISQLDELHEGLISYIEIRAGIPRRIRLENPIYSLRSFPTALLPQIAHSPPHKNCKAPSSTGTRPGG
jgi:hypothetical protein